MPDWSARVRERLAGLRLQRRPAGVERLPTDDDGRDRDGDDGEEQCAEQKFLPDGLGAEYVANGHVSSPGDRGVARS